MCALGPAGPTLPYFTEFVEGRRGEILDSALAVFGEKGYEGGTMREIARRVGVTEPALYRHYPSKEAILGDIVATAGDRITGQMAGRLDTLEASGIADGLLGLIEMRRGMSAEKRGGAQVEPGAGPAAGPGAGPGAGDVLHVLFHAAPHNEHFITLLRAHVAMPMAAAVRRAIPRVDAGFGIERSSEEVDAKVRAFMSLFVGYFTTSLVFDAPPDDRAMVDALLGMMGWHDV